MTDLFEIDSNGELKLLFGKNDKRFNEINIVF